MSIEKLTTAAAAAGYAMATPEDEPVVQTARSGAAVLADAPRSQVTDLAIRASGSSGQLLRQRLTSTQSMLLSWLGLSNRGATA